MSDLMLYFGDVVIVPSIFEESLGETVFSLVPSLLGIIQVYFVYVTTPTTFSQNHFETLNALSSWSINVHATLYL